MHDATQSKRYRIAQIRRRHMLRYMDEYFDTTEDWPTLRMIQTEVASVLGSKPSLSTIDTDLQIMITLDLVTVRASNNSPTKLTARARRLLDEGGEIDVSGCWE